MMESRMLGNSHVWFGGGPRVPHLWMGSPGLPYEDGDCQDTRSEILQRDNVGELKWKRNKLATCPGANGSAPTPMQCRDIFEQCHVGRQSSA